MLFRIINYLHLRYHKSLFSFNARKALIVLDNLWRLHHNQPFSEPQSPQCNYGALLDAKLLKRAKNNAKYSFRGRYMDKFTPKGIKLVTPLRERSQIVNRYIIGLIIALAVLGYLGQSLGNSYISVKTGTLSVGLVSGILAIVMVAVAIFLLLIVLRINHVITRYQKTFNRQAVKLHCMLKRYK